MQIAYLIRLLSQGAVNLGELERRLMFGTASEGGYVAVWGMLTFFYALKHGLRWL
ncbi:MAG: hypothetical protein WBQ95_02885 [Terracidiphilus sp.]